MVSQRNVLNNCYKLPSFHQTLIPPEGNQEVDKFTGNSYIRAAIDDSKPLIADLIQDGNVSPGNMAPSFTQFNFVYLHQLIIWWFGFKFESRILWPKNSARWSMRSWWTLVAQLWPTIRVSGATSPPALSFFVMVLALRAWRNCDPVSWWRMPSYFVVSFNYWMTSGEYTFTFMKLFIYSLLKLKDNVPC